MGLRRPLLGLAAALCLCGLTASGVGWWIAAPILPPPVVQPASPYHITLADEATIRDSLAPAEAPDMPVIFRLSANPAVLVLDFSSLHVQGAMLNRIAALVEKAGLPRDRVLNDAELDRAIRAGGETADTYYYGHDYRAADLARFFTLADRDAIALTAQEVWLRGLAGEQGWLLPAATGALISIPRAGADPGLDAAARATILHHELSHGEYFTRPAYAAATAQFWHVLLTADERAMFRRFLAGEGYDDGQEDLMMNETQAYLMFTPDARFFNAVALGTSDVEVARLRELFRQVTAPAVSAGTQPAPRRRHCLASVSTRRTAAARRSPRRRAPSRAACNTGM